MQVWGRQVGAQAGTRRLGGVGRRPAALAAQKPLGASGAGDRAALRRHHGPGTFTTDSEYCVQVTLPLPVQRTVARPYGGTVVQVTHCCCCLLLSLCMVMCSCTAAPWLQALSPASSLHRSSLSTVGGGRGLLELLCCTCIALQPLSWRCSESKPDYERDCQLRARSLGFKNHYH